MTISLYDASVAAYLQTLPSVSGFLARGLAHCRETGVDPEAMVETRLSPDMHPLRFQVQSVVRHSLGAIEAIRTGVLPMPDESSQHDYPGLQALIQGAIEALRKLTPEEINGRAGADVAFFARGRRRVATAERFVLSFSRPNLHFRATGAYDILRSKGVPIRPLDYIGALRLKT
jgi:uncharacterized protein